jgi:outer membrane protein assembly factor BamA
MTGHRERFQLEKYFGDANIYTTLVDYRRYFYIKPFTMAFRAYNYNLLGYGMKGGILPEIYLGYPWLVRGYQNVFDENSYGNNTFNVSWLSGSRIAVANAELRLPLTGPERLSMIKSKFLFSDLNFFFDAGMAWNKGSRLSLTRTGEAASIAEDIDRSPIMSTGVSLRVNLFGYMVIEPYYAFPIQNGGFRNGQFGLNFLPGW